MAVAVAWYLFSRVDELSRTIREQDSRISELRLQMAKSALRSDEPSKPAAPKPPPAIPVDVASRPEAGNGTPPLSPPPIPEIPRPTEPVAAKKNPAPADLLPPAPADPRPTDPSGIATGENPKSIKGLFTGDEDLQEEHLRRLAKRLPPPEPVPAKPPEPVATLAPLPPPLPLPPPPAVPSGPAPKPGEVGTVLSVRSVSDGGRIALIGLNDPGRSDLKPGMTFALFRKGERIGRLVVEAVPPDVVLGLVRARELNAEGLSGVELEDVAVLDASSIPAPPDVRPALAPKKGVEPSATKAPPAKDVPPPPPARPGGLAVDFVSLTDRVCVVKGGQKDGLRMGDAFEIVRDGKPIAKGNALMVFETETTLIWERLDPAVVPRKGDLAYKIAAPAPAPTPVK